MKRFLAICTLCVVATATLASSPLPVNKMVFAINNETGAPLNNLTLFPGITNLTPTHLTITSLPVGVSKFTFTVINPDQAAGANLMAFSPVKNGGNFDMWGGNGMQVNSILPQTASFKTKEGNQNYGCTTSPGVLSATCNETISKDTAKITAHVFQN